jgi:hypothetical protein
MSKTVKASALPGSGGGFTMGVWEAKDVPVGSEVGIVATPVASAAPSGELPPLPERDGVLELIVRDCQLSHLVAGWGENSMTAYARAAIAHQPPKEAMTDVQIDALMVHGFPRTKPSAAWREFARAVLSAGLGMPETMGDCAKCKAIGASYKIGKDAASAPNKQLVAAQDQRKTGPIWEAIQRACADLPEGYQVHVYMERDSGGVEWYAPDGDVNGIDGEGYISNDINEAIDAALAAAGEKGE